MKHNRLLKFTCLLIGLVMLVSAMPMSAIAPFSSGAVKAVSPAVSEGYINAVLRDFDDLSDHATEAVSFTVLMRLPQRQASDLWKQTALNTITAL